MTDDELKIIREVDKKADDAIEKLNDIRSDIISLCDLFSDDEEYEGYEPESIIESGYDSMLSLNKRVSVVLSELNSIKSNLKQVSETD